ncbi:ANK_REP_REGION domain-containing protein [Psidium guajava]|nr:ANK_REP_REGION domain-containing protein [Psidium guajava]
MDPQLYAAARSGDASFLERIEGNSTLLSQVTPKRNTILHVSAEFERVDFFKEATRLCPSLFDKTNSKQETPLQVAARVGCSELVDFIVDHARTAYPDLESQAGHDGGLQKLLRMVNLEGDNALHLSVRNGHYSAVKSLVEADAGLLDSANCAGESPFYIATAKGHGKIAELILGHSGSCLPGGTNGMTALHAALYYQLNGTMKKIVRKRADMIREGDALGWTPLHYAAHFGNDNAVRLFLRYESSAAYITGKDGESALHIAAFRGRTSVMEEVLKVRPDTCDLLDNKGRTALHAAVLGGQEKAVRFILGHLELVGLVNEADEDGNTPLHLAAMYKKYSIIAILARDSRVDIKAMNKKNLTALGIYRKYQESGFAAAKVYFMLKETYGVQDMQAWVNTNVKKMLNRGPDEIVPTENFGHKETSSHGNGNMLEIHLLVAMLIATVTFAAAFTMPGGYHDNRPDEGKARLTSNLAFKAFVIFDTMAFCCSVAAVYLQFGTSGGGHYERARFIKAAMVFIFIAILGMVLAFASAMYIVLAKSIGLGLTAYITAGCFIVTFFLRWFVDPLGKPDLGLRSLRKYLRNLLFRYEVI